MRVRFFVAVVPIALLAMAVVPAPSSAYTVRWDEQGLFLWGNLTWEGTSGKIVWGPNPNQADDQPAASGAPAQGDLRRLQYTRSDVLGNPAMPPPDEFVSEPVPFDLFVNVSRNIQLQLALKSHPNHANPCTYRYLWPEATYLGGGYSIEPHLNVEMRIGDKPLGYANGNDGVSWYYVHPHRNWQAPANPTGYGMCYYGMAPEMAVIPAGSVLTLKVVHARQIYDYPYGFQGDHRSTIRIPLFPPEEIPFRYPDLFAEDDFTPMTGTEGGAEVRVARLADTTGASPVSVPGIPALLGLSLLATGRRRAMGPMVGLLLVAGALSGCLTTKSSTGAAQGTEEALGGNVTNTFIQDRGGLTGEGLGSILGQVYDDMHIPIAGVHVSILGQADFTSSDSKGRFQFLNLLPGTYKIRLDKKEYRSFEADVEVKPGFVSRPSVMLYLKDARERDFRQHSHDYWLGQTTKEIANMQLPEICPGGTVQYCYAASSFRIAPKEGEPNTILPGTSEVEIVLDWDPDQLKVDRLGLAARSNNGFFYYANYYAAFNWSVLAPRAPGVPFRLPTSWESTDVGHQPYSTWDFSIFTAEHDKPSPEDQRTRTAPGYHQGSISVKVKIYKGALPLEAAHPDLWKGASQLQVLKNQQLYFSAAPIPQEVNCIAVCYYVSWPSATPGRIPYDTTWVEVKLKQARPNNPDFKWNLYYKPANVPSTSVNYQTAEGYSEIAPSSSDSTQTTWRIPIRPGEADFEYARLSTWHFTFRPDDESNYYLDYNVNNYGASYASAAGFQRQTLTLDVIAHRA